MAKADPARLRRLQRLEQVRHIAKQQALREAAEAEGTLTQLEALADRTGRMVEDYRKRTGPRDGFELHQVSRFVSGLNGISAATRSDAAQARSHADAKQDAFAQAKRRRAAAGDRVRGEERAIDRQRAPQVLGSRRQLGTALE